jgi:signal transduction histidine kinase
VATVTKRQIGLLGTATGFTVGLMLAALDHLLPPRRLATGPGHWVVFIVDWLAPPLAGTLLAFVLLHALRHKRLLEAERAASGVLAERLAGTERRQALWVIAAAVAHDLKNPLHNLQLLVEELEADPRQVSDILPRLRDNVLRATERLSEMSRAGQAPEETAGPVDLLAVLEDMKARLSSAASLSRSAVVVECPRGLSVRADSLALRSAVENVAANALEALQARGRGGKLILRARGEDSGRVELLVEDDGPGIPEPVRARLFTPFVSGSSGGTGLGLAIARALARAGGGDLVCADPSPGHTRFRFTFNGLAAQSA